MHKHVTDLPCQECEATGYRRRMEQEVVGRDLETARRVLEKLRALAGNNWGLDITYARLMAMRPEDLI